jgi:diguanylate cyclase (GGDEF)-like protein
MILSERNGGLSADDVILVVEDNAGDARLVELMLGEAFGREISVLRAGTRAAAAAHLADSAVTCVVLDLGLPDADGVDTVRHLAAWAPAAAIVVLTGADDAATGLAAVEAGAQDYLVKGRSSAETLGRAVRYAVVRKRAEQTLAHAQRIAHLGSWELDVGTDTMIWSEELYRLFGFDPGDPPSLAALLSRIHREDCAIVEGAIGASRSSLTPFDVEHRIVLPDGSIRWMHAQGHAHRASSDFPVLVRGTVQDVTAQRLAERALAHQALHDPLTSLPNRALLLDRLTQGLARLGRDGTTLGVIFLDIDRFKVINDSLGHEAGDEVLVAVAHRLHRLLRQGDTIGRIGGDEFVMLCEGLTGEEEAVAIADRVGHAMTVPVRSGEVVVSVSAGIAITTSPSVTAETLLRDADAAMYAAKRAGRARSAVFAESMRSATMARLDTEVSLRRAITNGELRVHYQPIVELVSGRTLGHEALVRWQHPEQGLIGPDKFIAIAEETGLIVPLGIWVLGEACRQATRFTSDAHGAAALTMSVNLSGAQLGQPDLVALVAAALRDADLAPERLQLEMTESVLMSDAATTITILRSLTSLGVRLGIDDFGTGYSSLAYLKRFPVSTLKIDRSFVDGLGTDREDAAIASAILSLADALDLSVVAEGVETPEQRACLVELGCLRAQGYLFARPVPASVAQDLLDAEAGRDAPRLTIVGAPALVCAPVRDAHLGI